MRRDGDQCVFYVLDDKGEPKATTDLVEWATWNKDARASRAVAQTVISESPRVLVSTVFLGIDHNTESIGQPLLFETMIFRDDNEVDCWRYETRASALDGHARAVKIAKMEAADEDDS